MVQSFKNQSQCQSFWNLFDVNNIICIIERGKFDCLIMDSVSAIFYTVGEKAKSIFSKNIQFVNKIFYMIILMIFVSLCFANRFIVVEIVQFCSLTRMTIGWRAENRRQPGKRADTIPFITVTLYILHRCKAGFFPISFICWYSFNSYVKRVLWVY